MVKLDVAKNIAAHYVKVTKYSVITWCMSFIILQFHNVNIT